MSERMKSLGDWLDERVAHRKILHELLDEPIVGGARWAYVFGSALALVFVSQVVTGIMLMTSYAPSAQSAWASVVYINDATRGGWLVRGIHHFGSCSARIFSKSRSTARTSGRAR